jgi:hypothetical protein
LARSDEEKTMLFAEHLAKVFTPNDTETDPEVEEQLLHIPVNIPEIKKITTKEVQTEINRLNLRKAPGIDRITPKMIKELPRKDVLLITFIINAIFRTNYWPEQLKTAEIILIHKNGKEPTKVESYRPISLLPIIAKLLEKLLIQGINNDPNTVEWIPRHQFGFREKHSTVQQTRKVVYTINQALERKEYCTSIFLDIKQAFGKVKLMKSYITDREFRVRINQTVSINYAIKSGVPQGSVVGPLLYLLHTADLPRNLRRRYSYPCNSHRSSTGH